MIKENDMIRYLTAISLCAMSQLNSIRYTDDIANALNLAQQELAIYQQQNVPVGDHENLINFLQFYKSWYQAVTPAPINLIIQLSPQAMAYVNSLKRIAEQAGFVVLREPAFSHWPKGKDSFAQAGRSKLKPIGDTFYQAVIKITKQQLQNNRVVSQQQEMATTAIPLSPLEPLKTKLF